MKIKKNIKNKLQYYPKLNINKIKRIIDNYEYISFDIFDTLIKRDVNEPNDVFKLMQLKYYKNNDIGYCNDRIEAEKNARINSLNEEITIKNIYEELIKNKKYTKKEASELQEIEVEIEKNLCTKNIELYEIYNYCLQKKKKIVISSNMYLPLNVIEEILTENDYKNYYKIYLSSTIGRKKDKSLFQYILKDLNINSNKLLHIGDSYKNDIRSSKKYGIRSIMIPKKINKLTHSELDFSKTNDIFFIKSLDSYINNRINLLNDTYYNFGYQSFGILLYGFNKMLHDDLIKKGINDVFFFSRDGYVIKKIYDEMYENDDKIHSHYIYVSRRSLRVPQIWTNPDLVNVVNTFPLAKLLTMETFIKNLGLDPILYCDKLKKHSLSLNTTISKKTILSNENVKAFYNDIKSDVIKHSKDECELLLEYFEQEKFIGNVAVVDIGWHGSLQYFIQKLSEKCSYNLMMTGYYIGLAKEAKKDINSIGYVIDIDSKTNSCNSWKSFNGLVETLFLAQEGSTEKFKKGKSKIEPVLYKYEYDKFDGAKEPEAQKVKCLQDGALDFVKDFKNSELSIMKFSSFTAFRKIYLTGISPNKKDLQMFSNFRFLEEQIDYLAMPKTLLYYIFHIKELKKDLFLSRWKVGFMKKLLKIKIPYKKVYEIFSRISDR